MTDVLIKRELLERVVKADASNGASSVDLVDGWKAMEQIRAILAAPRQPEGEGLEVVAYQSLDATRGGGWMAHKHALPQAHIDQGALQEPLCRLSDAQRAIAELREECERLRVKLMTIASAEPRRHNIEWAKAMAVTGNNESYAKWREAFDQRDKLAGLLRDERNWSCVEISCQRGVKDHCLCGTCRILRIDAALAEVKPCQESHHPAAT